MKEIWTKKPMHGNVIGHFSKEHMEVQQSFQWMKHLGLNSEIEWLIIGAQGKVLNTRYYCKCIMKQGAADKCSMCHSKPEAFEHIISGYQTLATGKCIKRHNYCSCTTSSFLQAPWDQTGAMIGISIFQNKVLRMTK